MNENQLPKTKIGELESDIAGMICYFPMMVSYIAPPLFLLTEPKENTVVRFHALQSILVTLGWYGSTFLFFLLMGLSQFILVFGVTPDAVELFALGSGVCFFLAFCGMMAAAFGGLIVHMLLSAFTAMGKNPKIPLLGHVAAGLTGFEG